MGELLHLVQRGGDWAGPQPAQAPLRCTKCSSPAVNGQCNVEIKNTMRYCEVLALGTKISPLGGV